jgi:uncharacterized protein YprB with RNaseH-like and TPR domain
MKRESDILLFDIEATSLNADFGIMLAFGYKWLGQPRATVLSLLDYATPCLCCKRYKTDSDTDLVEDACRVLSDASMWVTWYGTGYDQKFINSRIVESGLDLLPPVPHVDLYYVAKHKLKLSSNRLASVQDFLQLPVAKTPLTRSLWRHAEAGVGRALRYVVDHCEKDVDVLEAAYYKLRGFVRQHPRIAGYGPCRVCGSERLQKRGIVITALKNEKQRIQCQSCGSWDTRALLVKGGIADK